MTHRDEYERKIREEAEWAINIRERLHATFNAYADEAIKRREWEAATAYQTAASLVLGTFAKVVE